MPKPWGRIELDYINHDKFKAINANAICLWHEGKNYCDLRLTDGLIPEATAKLFRFYSPKALAMLITSAGLKPGTSDHYAPLWGVVEGFGWKMHDYLEHNDSRERALARIAKKDAENARKAENQRLWRERQEEERRAATVTGNAPGNVTGNAPSTDPVTPPERSAPLPDKQKTVHRTQHTEEQQKSGGGSKRPIYQSDRFVVFEWQLDALAQTLGPHVDDFDLHGFFDDLSRQSRDRGVIIPSDRDIRWKWLQAQVEGEARRRGLPFVEALSDPYEAELAALLKKGPSVRP